MALDPPSSPDKLKGGGEALRTRSSGATTENSFVAIDLGPRVAATNDANTAQT